MLFSYGEDLFGSDNGAIAEYNGGTLDACEVPSDAVFVRRFIEPLVGASGYEYRSMSDVDASPATPEQVGAGFEVDVGDELMMPADHACRFGNRPAVWIVGVDDVPGDFWGGAAAEPVDDQRIVEVPTDARTLFRLRVAQRVVDGAFG